MKKKQEELYYFAAILTPVFGLLYHRTRRPVALLAQLVSLIASTVFLFGSMEEKGEEDG